MAVLVSVLCDILDFRGFVLEFLESSDASSFRVAVGMGVDLGPSFGALAFRVWGLLERQSLWDSALVV